MPRHGQMIGATEIFGRLPRGKASSKACRFGIPSLERVLVEERWPKMQMIEFLWCLEFRLNSRDILYAFFVLFGFKYVLIHNDVRSGKPSETLITKCRQKAASIVSKTSSSGSSDVYTLFGVLNGQNL